MINYSEFEKGERQALLDLRSFIIKHGTKEVDAYAAQRLHDIAMDAKRTGGPDAVAERSAKEP